MVARVIAGGAGSLLLALVLVAPLSARAEDASAPRVTKLAVPDVRTTGRVDPKAVEGLSALLASEISGYPGVQVVSGADIRTLIGFEKQKEMLGCGDASCLAEIGGALGVDYVVGSEISEVGGTWLVSIALVDIAKAKAVGRLTKRAASEAALVETTAVAVRELMAMLPDRGGLAAAPPGATAVAPAPGQQGPSLVLPLSLLVAGAGALGGGGYFYGSAWSTHSDFEAGEASGKPTVGLADADAARTSAGVGVALLGAGALLVTGGILLWPSADAPATALVPTPSGAALALTLP